MSLPRFLFVVALLLVTCLSPLSSAQALGGYSPADLTSREVIAAAQVSVINKASSSHTQMLMSPCPGLLAVRRHAWRQRHQLGELGHLRGDRGGEAGHQGRRLPVGRAGNRQNLRVSGRKGRGEGLCARVLQWVDKTMCMCDNGSW